MPNILLLVVDCLRYDRLRLFERTLEAMGRQMRFENAWSVAPMSDPNFASILTGVHPDTHRVLTQCMDTELPTIAQALRAAGWDTIGASVKYPDGLDTGLPRFYTRGFAQWAWLPWKDPFPVDKVWRGHEAMGEPWFAMYRPMDLHERIPKEYDYDGLCSMLDADLADLVGRALSRWPDTVVVLTADHGQGLGERSMWHHREHLWWFLTHVPQVWAHPSFLNARNDHLVQHMDLTATVAGLAGMDFRSEGVDWSKYLLTGEIPKLGRDHVVLFSLGSEASTKLNLSELWQYRTIRRGGWTLHVDRRGDEIRRHLYCSQIDPRGTVDLADVGEWREMLASLEVEMGWPEVPELCENDVLERLRALGYAD